jgi:NTE family protein
MSPESTRLNAPAPQYLPQANRTGIALCLSGGGYRAALFHLGACKRLNELGVLGQIDTIASVSGGSIVAAHLASRINPWPADKEIIPSEVWEQKVAEPFRRFALLDIRTGPILERWLNPGKILRPLTTVEALARIYEKKLTDLKFSQLPRRPRFIFCATDMAFGVNWVFERERAGDYQIGYIRPAPADWLLARAVAASSCFPPVFGPMLLDLRKYPMNLGMYPNDTRRQNILGVLQITDGGVYDNMGLEPVWKDHQVVMVSDGGAPFPFQNETDPFRRILRYVAITSNQAGAIRKRWLIAGFKTQVLQGTYWGVASGAASYHSTDPDHPTQLPPLYYPETLAKNRIATIRTDMNGFSEAEIRILENHGYTLTQAALQNHLANLIAPNSVPFQVPHTEWMPAERVDRALRKSNRRCSLVKIVQRLIV